MKKKGFQEPSYVLFVSLVNGMRGSTSKGHSSNIRKLFSRVWFRAFVRERSFSLSRRNCSLKKMRGILFGVCSDREMERKHLGKYSGTKVDLRTWALVEGEQVRWKGSVAGSCLGVAKSSLRCDGRSPTETSRLPLGALGTRGFSDPGTAEETVDLLFCDENDYFYCLE